MWLLAQVPVAISTGAPVPIRTGYKHTRVTIGVLPGRRSTVIRPAASRSSSTPYFAHRLPPRLTIPAFGTGKVMLLAFHERCSNQIKTKALGFSVARAACSIHQSGTIANVSLRALLCRRPAGRLDCRRALLKAHKYFVVGFHGHALRSAPSCCRYCARRFGRVALQHKRRRCARALLFCCEMA